MNRISMALFAIAALGVVLRVVRLDFQPLWWDEGYTVFFATRDIATMLARTAIDIHPPLYYALLQLWIPFAGSSDVAFRLFSVAVGVATIPLLYLVGRQWFKPRVGLVGAFLLALAPLHIYYSQEVRMYGLVTLLALCSMALQLSLIARQSDIARPGAESQPRSRESSRMRQPLRWVVYVLVTTAALYTLYYVAFVVAAEVVVVLFWSFRRGHFWRDLRPWALAWLASFVLYLPWLLYTVPKLYVYVSDKVNIEQYAPLDPITYLAQHLIAFSAGHLLDFTWLGLSALPVVAIAVWGMIQLRRRTDDAGRTNYQFPITHSAFLIYFFVPLILGWLVNFRYPFHPFGYERSLLTVAPLFYLAVACGIDSLWQRRASWAYVGLAALVSISAASLYDFYSSPRYEKEDYRQLIRDMQELARPQDVVLAPYPWQIGYLEAYYRGAPLDLVEVPGDEWVTHSDQMDSALAVIHAASPRVWLVAYQTKGRRLEDQIANFFSGDYALWDKWYDNTRLEYFARSADPAMNERSLTLAPDLQLTSSGVSVDPLKAGADFIRVRLHWQARSNAYSYSLRLTDDEGANKIQFDAPVPSGNEIVRQGLVVPRTLAPGQYDLAMVVYHSADASPLQSGAGQEKIALGKIVVIAPP